MNRRTVDRVVAGVVFAYALVLYLLTMAPTVSFWDSGEFIAIANKLEVSHPPGAPFYMLIGRLFSMFVPTKYVAFSVNLISVLASAFTILLTHLIIVRLIRHWQPPFEEQTVTDRIVALSGGLIGALTFAVTDSFWFNAVEAEVYALSMFFTAAVVWLIMRWSEQARREEQMLAQGKHPFGLSANRYLVLIAYLFGLALGVHLLNLLAIFFIALIVFFTEYDRADWSPRKRWLGLLAAGIISAVAFFMIYPGIVIWLPEFVGGSPFPVFMLLVLFGILAFALYFTHRRRMQLANLISLCITVILIGYSSYAVIFIRSAADPPIDENDPETAEAIVSYLKREQYGSAPLLSGASYSQETGRIDQQKLFPRRHSPSPRHMQMYRQYDSDWEFFWDYQLGHMYGRYFMWNFAGRASDVQDAPAISGFSFVDQQITEPSAMPSPSREASRNAYYLLPFLLGLLGAGFHFYHDWRRAFSVLVLFLVTGVGIIIYLNQTPMQPRERDYSYVASFFAFSLWVGVGAAGLLQLAAEGLRERWSDFGRAQHGLMYGLSGLIFLAVPFWMAQENYDDHDRSGRYIARDYAYNLLQSVDKNAILFTNGDNDTFPLWYLQEVEGVRTDVRVVNLSLLNTPWYIKQLKNQWSQEAPPVPISLSNEQIEELSPRPWKPRQVSVPVDKSQVLQSPEVDIAVEDTSQLEIPMTWRLEGHRYNQQMNYLYVADIIAFDILQNIAQNGWKRPYYFAVTTSPSGQLNLQNHFQLEGMAYRVVPIEHDQPMGRIQPTVSPERLQQFRFTNLGDPDVYYNANIRRMIDTYRNLFAHTAEGLARRGQDQQAVALMDTLMANVPFSTVPGDARSFLLVARAYEQAGATQKSVEIAKRAEDIILRELRTARTQRQASFASQMAHMLRLTYLRAGEWQAASEFSSRLADLLGDNSYRMSPQELRRRYRNATQSDTAAVPAPSSAPALP